MSTFVLYTIPQSVWASAARLAIYELGYEHDVKFKDVNLAQGENFHPEFLAKNPNGTLPTLETPEGTLTNTTDVIKYLVEHASKEAKTSGATLIESLHSYALDPNFAKQMARNDEELAAKSDAFLLAFLEGRQRALEEQSARPEGTPYKVFYDAKKASNGEFLAIVNGSAPAEAKEAFFDNAKALHGKVRSFIYDELPKVLPNLDSDSGHFLGGDLPGEADFHLAAWLARIFSTCGADTAGDASEKFKAAFGGPLPPSVLEYWNAWWRDRVGERYMARVCTECRVHWDVQGSLEGCSPFSNDTVRFILRWAQMPLACKERSSLAGVGPLSSRSLQVFIPLQAIARPRIVPRPA